MNLKPLRDVYKLVRSWVCTALIFFLFMYIIRISQTWENYFVTVTSPNVDFGSKVESIVDPVFQLFNYMDGFNLNSLLVIIVSLMQGFVITLMLYIKVWKRSEIEMLAVCDIPDDTNDGVKTESNTKIGASTPVASGIGAVVSFFGVGCVPCKTALISPLMSLIFSAGGPVAFATSIVMDAVLLISIMLSFYAISKMLLMLSEVYYPAETEIVEDGIIIKKGENNE